MRVGGKSRSPREEIPEGKISEARRLWMKKLNDVRVGILQIPVTRIALLVVADMLSVLGGDTGMLFS